MGTKRPFSKLKKQVESLFEPSLKMEICCTAYAMRSKTGYASNSIPRFCVKLDGDILWDYPKDFPVKELDYGLWAGNNGISELIREYIDTPLEQLLEKEFKNEQVGNSLTDLFKAADRRLGKSKLIEWKNTKDNRNVRLVVNLRYGMDSIKFFKELADAGAFRLARQKPVTLEEAKAQVKLIHHSSSAKYKKQRE